MCLTVRHAQWPLQSVRLFCDVSIPLTFLSACSNSLPVGGGPVAEIRIKIYIYIYKYMFIFVSRVLDLLVQKSSVLRASYIIKINLDIWIRSTNIWDESLCRLRALPSPWQRARAALMGLKAYARARTDHGKTEPSLTTVYDRKRKRFSLKESRCCCRKFLFPRAFSSFSKRICTYIMMGVSLSVMQI